ncbi:MAG TPA: FIST N-terminal domain-containing protein [Acidimicrobiales bacterium]|nr:FIST N-terminal domain-containing protein [Acidimicrobiales bacterium]
MSAYASALSEHPLTATAVGEAVGQVLEALPGPASFAAVFVTVAHGGALEDVLGVVDAVLSPEVVVGVAAEGVLGPRRAVEGSAAISVWAATGVPARLLVAEGASAPDWGDLQAQSVVVLFADPYSFDAAGALRALGGAHPGVPVVGGFASAARGPGGNRLGTVGSVRSRGAVGAVLQARARVSPGDPWPGDVSYEGVSSAALAFPALRSYAHEGPSAADLADTLGDALDRPAVAGFTAAGVFGPGPGGNSVHPEGTVIGLFG